MHMIRALIEARQFVDPSAVDIGNLDNTLQAFSRAQSAGTCLNCVLEEVPKVMTALLILVPSRLYLTDHWCVGESAKQGRGCP